MNEPEAILVGNILPETSYTFKRHVARLFNLHKRGLLDIQEGDWSYLSGLVASTILTLGSSLSQMNAPFGDRDA